MSYHKDAISGLIILVLCLLGSFSVAELPDPAAGELVGTASLPKAALIALAVCGCIQLYRGLRGAGKGADASFNFCGKSLLFFAFYIMYMIGMVSLGTWLSGLGGGLFAWGGGFVVSTILFLLISLPVLGRKRPLEILGVAVITTGVLAVSFGGFFKILLP